MAKKMIGFLIDEGRKRRTAGATKAGRFRVKKLPAASVVRDVVPLAPSEDIGLAGITDTRRVGGSNLGDELIRSMGEALAHAQGHAVGRETIIDRPVVEVRRIRERVGLTQEQFAPLLGTSLSGLRKWEQKQRRPRGAAATLLTVMDREPEAFVRAIGGAGAVPPRSSGGKARKEQRP